MKPMKSVICEFCGEKVKDLRIDYKGRYTCKHCNFTKTLEQIVCPHCGSNKVRTNAEKYFECEVCERLW